MTCHLLPQPSKLSVEAYSPEFEAELLQLWLSSTIQGHPFIPEAYWEKELETVRTYYLPKSETWLAFEDNKLTGFISLFHKLVGGLYVLPEAQRKGTGTQLLDHAQSLSVYPLAVEVYEKNLRARRFYQKSGFVYQEARLEEETSETLLRLQFLA